MKIAPVILSGGSGTRLWPLSRKQHPKQYLSLTGGRTMLQETIARLDGLDNVMDPIIVCNVEHRFLVAEQCQELAVSKPTIILEPLGKNTAPAIAAAATQVLSSNDDLTLLVLSADHVIQNVEAFHEAIEAALSQAALGKMVTFGIVPTDANTGYGYIKASINENSSAHSVIEFVEKPDVQTAQQYLKQGGYLWNSGMFAFKASVLINELNLHSPVVARLAESAVDNAKADLDFIRLDAEAFNLSPSISIDCALMEKSDNVVVVPLDAGWNDVGSWSALYDIGAKDSDGNVVQGDVVMRHTTNTYISANHHVVAAIGIDDLIVVDTSDATLIASKDKAHEVAKVVELLRENDRGESDVHRKVYRPWGWFDSIESGINFQVKRLHINPGAKLSLQKHYQRAEHWVVVSGIATVVNGSQTLTLNKGESTYISIGVVHALENKTNSPLEVIEVQSGTYLGEDDIVRFEDIYGRAKN